jgi:parallel beta-helix repeat protein
MNRINISLMSVAALALVSLPLTAADGRIPIATAPVTLSSPGHYYLTNNLSVPASTFAAINITASDVTLDLNGMTLTHAGTANGNIPVAISTGNPDRVRVTGGRIVGGYIGVNFYNGSGAARTVQLDHLWLSGQSDNAIYIGGAGGASRNQALVYDNVLSPAPASCGSALTLLFGTNSRVERNMVNGCRNATFGWGIYLGATNNSVVADNQSYNSLAYGIYILGTSAYNEVIRNHATGNGTGIQISGSTNHYANNWSVNNTTNYGIVAGNRSSGNNCDPTVCTL